MKRDPRRTALWIFGILVVLCPCSLCGTGYYFYHSLVAGPAASLPSELKAAREEGLPLEPDDLRPERPVPDDQNAAKVYDAFFQSITRVYREHPNLTAAEENLTDGKATAQDRADLQQALDDAKGSIGPILAASSRPYCDFHLHYEDGFHVATVQFGFAERFAHLIAVKAQFLAEQGKVSEALDVLSQDMALGIEIGKTPTLSGTFSQLDIEITVMSEFCKVLNRCSKDPALLARAQKTLEGFGTLVDLRHALRGEVVLTLASINRSPDGAGQVPSLPATLRNGEEAKCVAAYRRMFKALPQDPNNWRGAYDSLKPIDESSDADRSFLGGLPIIPFHTVALSVGHEQANRRIASTAIRLMQDRLSTGKYPAILPNYGAISIDPFDGKPLRYRLEGTGFRLYSIDRDFQDNGGTKRTPGHPGDLFHVFD